MEPKTHVARGHAARRLADWVLTWLLATAVPFTKEDPVTAHAHTRPERFSETRWLARPNVVAHDPDSWQDVSVRPEGTPQGCVTDGFTVAIYTHRLLEEDFEAGVGPDPETLVDPDAEATLDVPNLAVYVARPFGPDEALFYVEALMVEAGVAVSSLEEVDGDRFFASVAGEAAGRA